MDHSAINPHLEKASNLADFRTVAQFSLEVTTATLKPSRQTRSMNSQASCIRLYTLLLKDVVD